ncbi:MAG: lysyl oxidase family protein, partial [Bacteroidota bacterium]
MNKALLVLIFLSFFGSTQLSAQCGTGEAYLEIYITPDANAGSDNTRWEVLDDNDQIILQGTSNYTFCLDTEQCYTFNIYDDFGNGYAGTPPGNYNVLFDGEVVDAGVDFGSFRSVNFGGCTPGFACNFALPLTSGGTYTTTGNGDTWYAYTPDATGRYTVSTCNLGNSCNTVIYGYDRCEGAAFENSQETAIFYSDDACGEQSDVLTHLFAGTTYYIRIGDVNGDCAGTPVDWELSYIGPVEGCTDPTSCNYDPLATVDDGSCIYNGNADCPDGPDLIVVPEALSNSLEVENFDNNGSCYIAEGCIKGYGVRQILRFTTHIKNIGTQDFYIGQPPSNPADENQQWEWDECHGHWHYEGYAEYRLYDANGVLQPVGFKNGFCVLDLECSGGGSPKYNCSNQGITAGCGDIYNKNLDCQWVDLTDVPNGNYTLVVTVNWDGDPDALGRNETSYDNNFAQVCFNLSRNGNGDAIVTKNDNCPLFTDCSGNQNGAAQPDCEGTCGGNVLAGDLNQNGVYETGDVQNYLSGLLDGSLSSGSCTDVSGDGTISMLDPVLLMGCILEQTGVHEQSFHSHLCNFPYVTVVHPTQTAELTLGNHNVEQQFVDVLLQNPSVPIMAFQFDMSGLVISNVEPLITETGYEIDLQYNSTTGSIIGFSFQESVTPRYTSPGALVRVYYSSLSANNICISNIRQIVNDRYEIVQTSIGATSCVPADGTGPVQYCAAASTNSTYEWIDAISVGSLSNQSGNDDGYGNFINQELNINAGATYDVTLTPDFS